MTSPEFKLLGISGSIRQKSYNATVLGAIGAALGDRGTLRIFDLRDIPLFDEDVANPLPPAVAYLQKEIAGADGIVLSSPEYNAGMSGVLKNALDWASQPYGRSVMSGKPVLVITASPASTGGVRAQCQINETLIAIGACLVIRPQAVIGGIAGKVADGRLHDEKCLTFLSSAVDDLLRDIRRRSYIMAMEAR